MGTLQSDGAGDARAPTLPVDATQVNESVAQDAHTKTRILVSGACVEPRFPLRKDIGKDSGNANEIEEGRQDNGEAIVLELSDVTETESEGGFEMKDVQTASSVRDKDEEPIELEVPEDTESQSEDEVELELVGDELVEVSRTRLDRGEVSTQAREDPDQPVQAKPSSRASQSAYATIELPGDEQLMRAVVACEEDFLDLSIRKMLVWEAIARHCGRGRFVSGVVAQSRVMFLRRVWWDQSHRVHGDLTEKLHTLLAQYHDATTKAGDTTGGSKRRKLLKPESEQRSMQKRILEKLHQLEKLEQLQGRTVSDVVDVMENGADDQEEEDYTVFPSLPKRSKAQPDINAALEVEVMRVVLRHAPELATAPAQISVWNKIAEDSRGRYHNGESALARTSWLCKVSHDKRHHQHAKTTPPLREMLLQFLEFDPASAGIRMSKARRQSLYGLDGEQAQPQKYKTIMEIDERLMALLVQKRPFGQTSYYKNRVWAEIVQTLQSPLVQNGRYGRARVDFLLRVFKNPHHDQHAKLTPGLCLSLREYIAAQAHEESSQSVDSGESSDGSSGSREDSDDEEEDYEDEEPQAPSESENDALLREILRVRPFHASPGACRGEWSMIAATLRGSLGRKVVFPTGQSCLSQMRRLLRIARDPQLSSRSSLPPHQRNMLRLIDTLLTTRWPRLAGDLTDTHHKLQSEVHELLKRTQSQTIQGEDLPPIRSVSIDNSDDEGKRDRVLENEADYEDEMDVGAGGVALQGRKRKRISSNKPIAVSEPRAQDEALSSNEIKTLHTEVAMCRAQMALRSSGFETERREHRTEMRAMMEMLKQERAANMRETATMLEMIQREQEDRKQAFAAMMNLVTRSVFPTRD